MLAPAVSLSRIGVVARDSKTDCSDAGSDVRELRSKSGGKLVFGGDELADTEL